MLTQTKLKEILYYDPETGLFTWLILAGKRVKIGDIAGSLCQGYLSIMIYGKSYKAHRLAFLYMTGSWPKEQIDHINHVRDDNRWINLREATNQENCKNQSRSKNNTSGVCGVIWHKQHKKWMAYIMTDSKQKHLGLFVDKLEAICARKSAEIKYVFHENHGK